MEDSTNPRTQAIAALAELFFESACRSADLAQLESSAIDIGHGCMAEALGLALEALDARLLAQKTEGISVHDVRSRTLATEIGDVGFSLRRYRDRFGEDVYLLTDALDIPYGCRISSGAQEFLVQSASLVSYAKAAKLLARHGSSVKATSVMRCPRDAGALCAADNEKAARELYRDGVLPGGETCARELCMEADGTYFRAQGLPDGAPKRFEVKAVCAYAEKEAESGKVRRRGTVHHALVGRAGELWSEGVATVGKKYDLAKIERVHLGGGRREVVPGRRTLLAECGSHVPPGPLPYKPRHHWLLCRCQAGVERHRRAERRRYGGGRSACLGPARIWASPAKAAQMPSSHTLRAMPKTSPSKALPSAPWSRRASICTEPAWTPFPAPGLLRALPIWPGSSPGGSRRRRSPR